MQRRRERFLSHSRTASGNLVLFHNLTKPFSLIADNFSCVRQRRFTSLLAPTIPKHSSPTICRSEMLRPPEERP